MKHLYDLFIDPNLPESNEIPVGFSVKIRDNHLRTLWNFSVYQGSKEFCHGHSVWYETSSQALKAGKIEAWKIWQTFDVKNQDNSKLE